MILITGATGNLGGEITRRYISSGQKLRLMSRTPERLKVYKELGAEVVYGDLCNPESVQRAVEGADKVVASVHSMIGRGKYSSKKVDEEGHKRLIIESLEAGVSKFVYISAVGVSENHPIDYWRFKYRVEQYLKNSGLNYTIIRPTAYMETHAHMLIGQHIIEKGQVTLYGSGENLRNFVAVEDVAKFVLMALEDPSTNGETIEVGGKENLSSRDVVDVYSKFIRSEPKITKVPLPVVRALSLIMRPFHSGLSRVMKITVYSETNDMTFRADSMIEKYGVEPLELQEWVLKNAIPASAGIE